MQGIVPFEYSAGVAERQTSKVPIRKTAPRRERAGNDTGERTPVAIARKISTANHRMSRTV